MRRSSRCRRGRVPDRLNLVEPFSCISVQAINFSPYETLAPVGKGGTGEVYRARDPQVAATCGHQGRCSWTAGRRDAFPPRRSGYATADANMKKGQISNDQLITSYLKVGDARMGLATFWPVDRSPGYR